MQLLNLLALFVAIYSCLTFPLVQTRLRLFGASQTCKKKVLILVCFPHTPLKSLIIACTASRCCRKNSFHICLFLPINVKSKCESHIVV